MKIKFRPKKSRNKYKFGQDTQNALGSIIMRIPIGRKELVTEKVDIVRANVPFLIGLDFLDTYKMYVNNVENLLVCPHLDLYIPTIRKNRHIYLEWEEHDKIHYTKQELIKLHRNFSHPNTDKLLNLLKLAKPDQDHEQTKKILEEIAANCEACQRFTVPPMRFKTSLQTEEELVFGDEISIDLMYIDNCAILHVVDTATRFSAATFLDKHGENYGQSVDGIWLALNACWVTLYTGYPNRLRTDQGQHSHQIDGVKL